MLDKWDWFKIFCTSSIYSVPVQKKLYQRKKLYYNISILASVNAPSFGYSWFNKGCFGNWELRIGKVLFGVHSSKGLKKSLHCFLCPNGQCPIARGGGGTLYFMNFWVGMCRWDPGTLEPLTCTRASWILLPYTRVNSPNPPYPRVAVSLV